MEGFKHIVLATDMSDSNLTAVEYAIQLKKKFSAKLSIVMAVPVPSYYNFKNMDYDQIKTELVQKYEPHFNQFLETNKLSKDSANLVVGEVSTVLFDFIQSSQADLLILGSHGEYGIRNQVGSTLFKLLQRSECNIFIANAAKH